MSRIGLSNSNYAILPEGVQVLKCTACEYDEKFGNIVLTLSNNQGVKHSERYIIITATGEQNTKALNAFSFTARKLIHGNPADVDTEELVGKYIKVRVEHEQVITKQGKTMTVARLNDKEEVTEDEAHQWFPDDAAKSDELDFNNIVI